MPYSLPRHHWFAALLLASTGPTPCLFAQNSSAVPVVAVEARSEVVTEKFVLTGTVTPRQQAALSPRAGGLVETVHVDAGAEVTQGDVLVTLDAAMAKLALQATESQLAQAQAQLAESERLVKEAKDLLERNAIPETQVMTRDAGVAIAAAAARRADAAHRQQAELVARHHVVAPFSGVITRKLTEAGEWVTTGTPVMRLVSLEGARVDVQVPQERISAITPRTPVEFELASDPGNLIPGTITARVPVSNPDTRSALVRIEPRESSAQVTPGKSARVTFRLASDRPVLTGPRDAVIRRADGTVNAWIAEPAGSGWTATMRRLELGRTFSDQVEVRDGLEAGQLVIIRGNETLQPGQAVRLENN